MFFEEPMISFVPLKMEAVLTSSCNIEGGDKEPAITICDGSPETPVNDCYFWNSDVSDAGKLKNNTARMNSDYTKTTPKAVVGFDMTFDK